MGTKTGVELAAEDKARKELKAEYNKLSDEEKERRKLEFAKRINAIGKNPPPIPYSKKQADDAAAEVASLPRTSDEFDSSAGFDAAEAPENKTSEAPSLEERVTSVPEEKEEETGPPVPPSPPRDILGEGFSDPATRDMWKRLEEERQQKGSAMAAEYSSGKKQIIRDKLVKDLIAAAGLLFAAHKKVQSKIEIKDNSPEMERSLDRLQRDIGMKRDELNQRLNTARSMFEHQERKEEVAVNKQRAAEKATAASITNKQKDEQKIRKEFDQDMQKTKKELTAKLPKNSEDMYKRLKEDFPNLKDEDLKKYSGVDQVWSWFDNEPSLNVIKRLYDKKAKEETEIRYKKIGRTLPTKEGKK